MDDRKARRKAAADKYRMSEKGRAKRSAYKRSETAKLKQKQRRSTPEYKAYIAKYLDAYQKREDVKRTREMIRKGWKGKAGLILRGMLSSSARKNHGAVEWTRDEILEVIKDGKCCKTGIAFRLSEFGSPAHERNPFAPSPDRLDNKKGYTKQNVQWVCWMYNQLKGQADEETVELFLRLWIGHNRNKGMSI